MTKFRILHPKSSIERIYLPRKEGGRGLINISNMCKTQVTNMRQYFQQNNHPLIQTMAQADQNYTPLNLNNNRADENTIRSTNSIITAWQDKILHGKYPRQLSGTSIDKTSSILYLTKGYLYPETEGFIMGIQDKIIRTRNYEKFIMKLDIIDKCRKCGAQGETIEHITAGCPVLANTEYLQRHNQVAKIIHSRLALNHKLLLECQPYYKYSPLPILENAEYVLYWDRLVITDKTIDFNRPDILLINKTQKIAWIVDIAIPLTQNTDKAETEKCQKYQNLAIEIKRLWKLDRVTIVPLVISVDGVCTVRLRSNLELLGLPSGLVVIMQKAAILQTCHIVRKFLNF